MQVLFRAHFLKPILDMEGGVTFSRSDQMEAPFTRLRNSDPVSGLGLKSRVQGQYELYRYHPSGGLQPALGSVL